MLTDDQKKKIESLSTEEMAYEINRGKLSRFQREKFAYLKFYYQSKQDVDLHATGVTWVDDECPENANGRKKANKKRIIKVAAIIITVLVFPILVGIAIYEYKQYRETPSQVEQKNEQRKQK